MFSFHYCLLGNWQGRLLNNINNILKVGGEFIDCWKIPILKIYRNLTVFAIKIRISSLGSTTIPMPHPHPALHCSWALVQVISVKLYAAPLSRISKSPTGRKAGSSTELNFPGPQVILHYPVSSLIPLRCLKKKKNYVFLLSSIKTNYLVHHYWKWKLVLFWQQHHNS